MTIPRFINRSIPSRARPSFGRAAVVALGCAFSLAVVHAPASRAGEAGAALRPLDDHLPALPLTGTFQKEDGDNGPYGLSLKNTSANSIRASGSVLLNICLLYTSRCV